LLKSGSRKLALGVDSLSREMNSMVMPLPEPAARSPYFSGGIALEDGQVILVINPGAIFEGFKGGALEHRESAPPESRVRRHTILVVDDSFTARTLQKNILETAGYEVKIAVDGAQALATLKASTFDAVVADVQMPRMDGFQLLEAMKADERLQSLPVVLVTSLSSEEDRARGMSLGARAYIVKQRFDHKELLEVVRQIL
jgi:two-component system chemotaxis sensor kinase CheA